jgi:L-fucose mutarotase/ribose pyranase (RbsD/FucU family)
MLRNISPLLTSDLLVALDGLQPGQFLMITNTDAHSEGTPRGCSGST